MTNKAALNIYPNPANDLIIMDNLPNRQTQLKIDLLDVTGCRVDSFSVPPNQTRFEYNSSLLKPGVYLIRITSQTGYSIEKIVKK